MKFAISWYSEIHSKWVGNSWIISLTLLGDVVSIDYESQWRSLGMAIIIMVCLDIFVMNTVKWCL